jgi:pSer/pThr/pTyr-binding forkhead associated (FHA) protein
MNLQELESRLQNLVEVRLLSTFPVLKTEDRAIQKLAAAMQTSMVTLGDGSLIAPNVYTIIVHPDAAARWQQPRLLESLIEILNIAVQEAGLNFLSAPTITIATDTTLSPQDVQVVASHRVEPVAETQSVPLETPKEEATENIPENAFLIVEGIKVFPLTQSVINIGRRLDNHLVIDDPRVSRNHAQLRAIKGRFVLFDLNSTGGTFVNGQRTSQTVLYPGDVISLAGVALIFGQDNPPHHADLADTAPFEAAGSERPTASTAEHPTARFDQKKK